MDDRTDRQRGGWMDRRTDGLRDVWMGRRTDGRMGGRRDGRRNRRASGVLDVWTNGWAHSQMRPRFFITGSLHPLPGRSVHPSSPSVSQSIYPSVEKREINFFQQISYTARLTRYILSVSPSISLLPCSSLQPEAYRGPGLRGPGRAPVTVRCKKKLFWKNYKKIGRK